MFHTRLSVKCDPEFSEILIAELSEAHFDTFLENDTILQNDLEEYRTLYANNELAIRKLHNRQNKYKLPETLKARIIGK